MSIGQRSPLGPIETAYLSCGPQIIPVAYGPPSKVIGQCMQSFPGDTGVCVGTFHSRDVDTNEYNLRACVSAENNLARNSLPSVGVPTGVFNPARPVPPMPMSTGAAPRAHQSVEFIPPDSASIPFRFSTGAAPRPHQPVNPGHQSQPSQPSRPTQPNRPVEQRGGDPGFILNHENPNTTITSRPPMYNMDRAWSPCDSYGSYSSAPNAELSCGVGNSLMGSYGASWCNTAIKYNKPYILD